MSMLIGEALAGDGNEVAHIDLLIGSKDGPVGIGVCQCPGESEQGHSNLLAVITPNLAVKPATVMVTKVTIERCQASGADVRTRAGCRRQGRCRFGG